MAKTKYVDPRFDFRQGRNSVTSPDLLNPSELVDATNVRLDTLYGGFTKRTGTRRLHATAIGSGNPVTGLQQWDAAGTKELVAVSNGNLYHKTSALGDFTAVTPATAFSTTTPQTFATFRSSASAADLLLYIAGDRLYKWDGSSCTVLAPSLLPTDIDRIAALPTRMFLRSKSFKKSLYWSQVGDAELYAASGLLTDGGTAMVGVLNGEEINSLEVIGSSLLIGAEDSVSRFTGSSSDNIQIASDTLGLSSEIGPVGVNAIKRFETAAAFVNKRGAYIVTESGLTPMSLKVEADFLNILPAHLPGVAVGYHAGRAEIWFALPGSSDGDLNKTVYVFSTKLQAWMGPWIYPFGITSFARYEDSNGAENLVAACADGFVRLMDDVGSYTDDRLADGTAGANVAMLCEPAPHFWQVGSQFDKSMDKMMLDADVSSGDLQVAVDFDNNGFSSGAILGAAGGIRTYRVDLDGYGKRCRVQFSDSTAGAPTVAGYSLLAWGMNRL